jgi:hypothetical protein
MSGKYDPADKTRLLAENPSISSTCELMVAAAEAQFPPKAKRDDSTSRACVGEDSNSQPRKRGRKPVVTPERIEMICGLLAKGESEKSACIRAGIGLTAWNTAKRSNAGLRQRHIATFLSLG